MKVPGNYKKTSGIYCIHNMVSNKRYIGSSVDITHRLQRHRSMLRKNYHFNGHLQNSYNKNGESVFQMIVLETTDDLETAEQKYIDMFKPEYNICMDVVRLTRDKSSIKKQADTRKKKFKLGTLDITNRKIVHKYSLDGEYLDTYESVLEAGRKENTHRDLIRHSCQKKVSQAKGFLYRYDGDTITLSDIIFGTNGDSVLKVVVEGNTMYFRSQLAFCRHFEEKEETVYYHIHKSKKELMKNKYKIDLIKSRELLETLEGDDQQLSDIEIY